MTAFSVTVNTSTSSYLLQSRRFSIPATPSHLQGSVLQNWKIGNLWMQGLRSLSFNWRRRRRALICAVNQDAREVFNKTVEIDRLIDMLRDIDLDEEKIESTTDVLQGILKSVVDDEEEIPWPPRDPQALTLIEKDISQREQEGQLDEGFFADFNAQLQQAKEDGDKPRLKAMLQRVLQLYAARVFLKEWSQFAKRVSGEWDGFEADFNNEGKPIELPESVVPEAYREWEVKVFDWQTQCPTLAEPEEHVIVYKNIRLLPTVGCEADAATIYSIDERKVGGESSKVTTFAYQSSGSYVAVWQKEGKLLELEYCLINPQDVESRVRIIQAVHLVDSTNMVLQSIKVFREQWYGPFRNGEQLGGCAIRDSGFASTAPLTASQVTGVWQASKAVTTFGTSNTGIFRALIDDNVQNCVRDGCNEILLPKQMWCSLKQKKDGETVSEVGWLLDRGQAITSSCLFSSTAKLKEISISLETKDLQDL